MLAFLEGPELLIVAVIVLLVFGGSQLPKLARSLGEAQRELKKTMAEDSAPASSTIDSTEPSPSAPALAEQTS
jgi:sec-independent protein translocase protein TatA